MPDQVEVESALVTIIAAALYPNGTGQACAAGVPCKVFRGWPTTQAQEQAKADNTVNVSVATRNGVETNTTRYPREWQTSVFPVHTLTAAVLNNTVTIGGTVSTPQNVLVLCGRSAAFSYAVQAGDTLNSIAAGLATLIAAQFVGTVSNGAVITIPFGAHAGNLTARIASTGTSIKELKRQNKSFQISIWAPPHSDPNLDADKWRTDVAKVVDPALAVLGFINFTDGACGFVHYERTIMSDVAQEEGLYRRDLFYWVEYPTVIAQTDYEVGDLNTPITGGQAAIASIDSPPVNVNN